MADEKPTTSSEGAGKAFDRRTVIKTAAAATGGAILPVRSASAWGGFQAEILGAFYEPMKEKFNKKYYNDPATVQSALKIAFGDPLDRNKINWGNYQTHVVKDPADWANGDAASGAYLQSNWENFSREARDALRRLPWDKRGQGTSDLKRAADPFNPGKTYETLLDYLDNAIRVALVDAPKDHNMPVKLFIDIGKHQAPNRNHAIDLKWTLNHSGGNLKLEQLDITMTCPKGGWDAYARWPQDKPSIAQRISKLKTTIMVPADPVNLAGNQVVFIFNGMESDSTAAKVGAIIQPVLQWHQGWSLRSWYVPATESPESMTTLPLPGAQKLQGSPGESNDYYYTTQVDKIGGAAIRPGTILTGVVEGWQDAGKFNYTCYFLAGTNSTRIAQLTVLDVPKMVWAVAAIEAYGATPPDGYPGRFSMTNAYLELDGNAQPSIPWRLSKPAKKIFKVEAQMSGAQLDFEP